MLNKLLHRLNCKDIGFFIVISILISIIILILILVALSRSELNSKNEMGQDYD